MPKPKKRVIRRGFSEWRIVKLADGKLEFRMLLLDSPRLVKATPQNRAEKP